MTGSSLKAQIQQQMTSAMKSGQKVELGALRMFVSSIRYREDELGHELSDDEVRDVAAKEVKKRTESIEAFEGAGRDELADKERQERDVIQVFAPARLSDADVDALIGEAFDATGATSMQEIGAVMSFVMGRAKGQVDGKLVQAKVRARLGG